MHATEPGYGGSAGDGLVRGVALVAVAVVIGALLLFSFKGSGDTVVGTSGNGDDTGSTNTGKTTTTVTPPTTEQTALRLPGDINVIALNATKTSGIGTKAANIAKAAGYTKQLKPADATTAVKTATKTSLVYFAPGFDREAGALAEALGLGTGAVQPLPATTITAADLKTAELVIVAGPEFVTRPTPTTPKPTTTVKATGPTTTVKRTTTTAKG